MNNVAAILVYVVGILLAVTGGLWLGNEFGMIGALIALPFGLSIGVISDKIARSL